LQTIEQFWREDHVRWCRRRLSDEGAVAQLGDECKYIVEVALLNTIGGALTAKQAVGSEQPQVGLLGPIELGALCGVVLSS